MPIAAINAYLERLPARQAELKLVMSDAVSTPHMKERDRAATLKGWMRAAKIDADANVKPASPARLKLMGIGVRHV